MLFSPWLLKSPAKAKKRSIGVLYAGYLAANHRDPTNRRSGPGAPIADDTTGYAQKRIEILGLN